MATLILAVSRLLAVKCTAAVERDLPPLRVSENQRFLVTTDGKPFFWLADTAWELFHRLNREEATRYLEDRASKGFTIIQAVALAELDGLNTPNAYGHRPLVDNDPNRPDLKDGPDNDYWDHVDFIVRRANELGLRIGFLPTWGDKWHKKGGKGPLVGSTMYGRAPQRGNGMARIKEWSQEVRVWFMPAVPANLGFYLGIAPGEMPPRLAALLLGLLRALGGCLLAVATTAFVLINGPLKRGERWASWAVLILIGVSEGINATRRWRFGSPYCFPLTFVAMAAVGILILPNKSEPRS